MNKDDELEKKRIAYANNVYSSSGPNSLKDDLLRDREKNRSIKLKQSNQYFSDILSTAYRGNHVVEEKEESKVEPRMESRVEPKIEPRVESRMDVRPERLETPKRVQESFQRKETVPPVPKKEVEVLEDSEETIEIPSFLQRPVNVACEKEEEKEEIKVPLPAKKEEKVRVFEERTLEKEEYLEKIEQDQKDLTIDDIIREQELIQKKEQEGKKESALIEVDSEAEEEKKSSKNKKESTKKLTKEEKKLLKQKKKEEKMQAKKKKKKMKNWEKIFCFLSFAFILGCCIFYGSRLVKYYKIYNPVSSSGKKIELLSNSIAKGSPIVYEGDGLYMLNGSYTYKGKEVNNYLLFSNYLWRIVRSNKDGSLDIVLDDVINTLKWDSELKNYTDSDIHQYLNDVFVDSLNTDLLVKTTSCDDVVDDVKSFRCSKSSMNSYVKLLSIGDYLNSEVDGKSYIANYDKLWLSTRGEDFVWNINEGNLSNSESSRTYGVKPVVTLKNSAAVLSGKGSKEDPYVVEEKAKELTVGSYVKLGNDSWIVYETDKKQIRLVYANLYNDGITTYRFSSTKAEFDPSEKNSLAYYLNNTFYESLSYKDLLEEVTWYTGGYENSYKDVREKSVTAKVASYNVLDLKYNTDVFGYHLITPANENENYLYNDELTASKIAMYRPLRPTICISKEKIKNGEGTVASPYELEV